MSESAESKICEAALEDDLAIAYVRGELDRFACQAFEVHLLRCEGCAAVVAAMQDLIEAAHNVRGAPWKPVVVDEEMRSIGARRRVAISQSDERQKIVEALAALGGSQTKSAKVLGLGRAELIALMDKYRIPPSIMVGPGRSYGRDRELHSEVRPKKGKKARDV